VAELAEKDLEAVKTLTDEQLLSKCREDADLYGSLTYELISRYIELVKIKARKIGRMNRVGAVDTDDLVSEGFLGLLSAIRTFNGEKGTFASYANICVGNKIKTAAFSFGGGRTVADGEFDVSQTPDKRLTEEFVLEKESESEIASRLSKTLTELELRVFSLYLNSYSYRAIAARLAISEKSVDNALSRARGKLRKIYK